MTTSSQMFHRLATVGAAEGIDFKSRRRTAVQNVLRIWVVVGWGGDQASRRSRGVGGTEVNGE
ncbi:hypothetical protein RUND412_006575, partial [Rhizina undulata]